MSAKPRRWTLEGWDVAAVEAVKPGENTRVREDSITEADVEAVTFALISSDVYDYASTDRKQAEEDARSLLSLVLGSDSGEGS